MLFELSLGLSAWKQYGETRWALRCNPSSGNLHPTEGYAVLPAMEGLQTGGVFHYACREHQLEQRAVLGQVLLPESSILVGLTSIHWREAWKYGERAFRYCQHDMGHAVAAVRYACAALGWTAKLLANVADPAIADLLGLSHAESFRRVAGPDREHPGALLLVGPPPLPEIDIAALRDSLNVGEWRGEANALSSSYMDWPAIDDVAKAAWLEAVNPAGRVAAIDMDAAESMESAAPMLRRAASHTTAAGLIKQRRSAVAFDDVTSISAQTFYAMLDRLLPRRGIPPWDTWPWPPRVHCAIFVHRVEGLSPGLYLFERSDAVHEKFRKAFNPSFVFERPHGCPEQLRLFRLADGDLRQKAQVVSCHQKIAGAGAFSLGMLAEFEDSIRTKGSWWYRRLFWESGMLGHAQYLEAEAAGVRGTGIGCYFDDAFHSVLGLQGSQFQSLYHFTVGGPVEDTRLLTLSSGDVELIRDAN